MNYESHGMQLNTVRIVRKNAANDVLVCRDLNSDAGSLYTLLLIKDHKIVKQVLETFEHSGEDRRRACVASFSWNGDFCMVFPYKSERPLTAFYAGERFPLSKCEDICIHLILACMMEGVPYPLLYLMLQQNQIHLAKDDSVFLSYQIDLAEIDPKITEKDCAVQCARILLALLRPKAPQKAVSYTLLKKKIEKRSYSEFSELYKDIRIAAVSKEKRGIRARLSAWITAYKDTLFRILLIICVFLALAVAVTFLAQLIFGDAPWLRLFTNSFRVIGTENLRYK